MDIFTGVVKYAKYASIHMDIFTGVVKYASIRYWRRKEFLRLVETYYNQPCVKNDWIS
jgi:hypothetical protein